MNGLDLHTPGGVTLALLPELILTVAALVVLLLNAWRHRTAADSRVAGWVSLLGVVASVAAAGALWQSGAVPVGTPHMMALDGYRFAAIVLILVATAGAILVSLDYLEREQILAPEYYSLMLMSAVGMMFLAGAEDLIVLFLGLEVMSVPVYVLAGFDRRSVASAEAGLKYFLIGAFASAFLLYGIALTYGATGTTSLTLIGAALKGAPVSIMASAGVGLLLIGLGFKVAAVPFHMWAPDVYDGAPTPVTAFMATGVKVAGFIALVRVLLVGFPTYGEIWQPLVAVLAIASMVLGNLVALAQRSLKRMLAYSSIAHAGYLLAAIWPGTRASASATLLYLVAYAFTTLATFGILGILGRGGERDVTVQSVAGLAHRRPGIALALTICLFSLLGFPGTLGFIGKWIILSAVVAEHHQLLAVILVVTSLISAGYYLPIVRSMYMREPETATTHVGIVFPGAVKLAVVLALVVVVIFGVWPAPLMDAAAATAQAFQTRVSDVASLPLR